MSQKLKLATDVFANGYNCSQSVFSVFATDFGVSRDLSLRLASPMGAGIARRQETCGAVTGGILALGLKYGKGEQGADADKKLAYEKAISLMSQFEQRHGSTVCLQLLDGNCMNTEEGVARIAAADMFNTRCSAYVQTAVEIVEQLLED